MKNIVASLFLLLATAASAQSIVSGEVYSKTDNLPIEFAKVALFSARDSVAKGGAFTDEKGKFLVENVQRGEYYVVISYGGYENSSINGVKISDQPTLNLGKIQLAPLSIKELEEVMVVGKLETLVAGIDKKVYNIDQDVSARGASADEVLNNIPSITLDEEGRLSLRGEGSVTVLINGQPSAMTGSGGDFLSSIPASQIERVEVVTNPSAKYDPDGTAGIINIVLKKNKIRGINGQVSGTGGLAGHDHKLNAALSFRNDKINVYGSYAFDYMEGFRNNIGDIERILGQDSVMRLHQDRRGTDFKRGHIGNIGLDYYISNRSTIGFSANGQMTTRRRTGVQWNTQYIDSDSETNVWRRTSQEPDFRKALDMNMYFNHNFKNELSKLSASANYSTSNREENGHFDQLYSIMNGTSFFGQPLLQNQYSTNGNGILTAQVDFENILPKIKARYEVGAKAIIRNEKLMANSESFDYLLNAFAADTFANYNYRYNENVYSVYGSLGQELGKFKYQVGLRGEYVRQDPRLLSTNQVFTKEYAQLYPSAHARYALSSKSEISLGYSRRINRPSSGDLNPFTNYSDPFNLRTGNPDLKPEFINSIDLGYTQTFKSSSITGSVYYRHTTDVIQRVKVFTSENTAAVTMANLDQSKTLGLELVYQIRPTNWWRNTISFNGNYIDYANATNGVDDWNNNGFYWGVKYSGQFDFWKKTATLQVNATYNAPRVTAQGTIYLWNFVDISAQKAFFNKKFIVGIKFADIFDIKGFKMKVEQPTMSQQSNFNFQTRRVYLTLTYKFGKMEISQKQMAKEIDGGGGDM